jgi:serine protease AprX
VKSHCGKSPDVRANALWGKPGRKGLLALLATLALVLPATASAHVAKDKEKDKDKGTTFVAPGLVEDAKQKPNEKIRVIVQARGGSFWAEKAFKGVGHGSGHIDRRLNLVGGVVVELKLRTLELLAKVPGLVITPDAPVKLSNYSSSQLWPYQNGASLLWGTTSYPAPNPPAIAIVDSGIQASKADFGNRVVAQVNLTSRPGNSAGDGRGHGTFVAGIAAGRKLSYAGVAPKADIVSIDVMDDEGVARTSDVIAAAEWIVANKAQYGIRVANFSLHSTVPSNFTWDPLDKAVEKLWLSGVVVVAAAGNYGTSPTASGVKYAPGNDPFVITVGALDLKGTARTGDDIAAPWSAFGYTFDGFAKPELAAAGRYMIGPVPETATLPRQRPSEVRGTGYMQLSGTSFAAPVVAGAAAQILARHPSWTPDQVKGALMLTARPTPSALPLSTGVGEVNILRAALVNSPPNPNAGLNQFVVPDPSGASVPVFDDASWSSAARSSASWSSLSWNSASWSSASWSSASWSSASWSSASWSSVSWSSMLAAAGDLALEQGASADVQAGDGYTVSPDEAADLEADPELAGS